jgi:hypothetical protein
VWDQHYGMRKLREVLTDEYGLELNGWTLTGATGVSDDGTVIVGSGVNPAGRLEAWRAVLAAPILLGDVNLDGEVNGLDVDPFVEVLLSGTDDNATRIAADMNNDGEVNGLDVYLFVVAVVGGAQSVPEPSTLLVCIALGVIGALRKWGV